MALFTLGVFGVPVAGAETTCSADVEYLAIRKSEDKETKEVTFWGSFSEKGALLPATKHKLEQVLKRERGKAIAECKRLNDSGSSCVLSQLGGQVARLQTMDFASRRLIEKKVTDACVSTTVVCSLPELKPIDCVEEVAPTPPPVAADGDEKDKGKEKAKEAKK